MKFAKELDDNAIPEWRDKYLDYKAGKKKLKAVVKAIRDTNAPSSNTNGLSTGKSPFASLRDGPIHAFLRRDQQANAPQGRSRSEAPSPQISPDRTPKAKPIPIGERAPLRQGGPDQENGPRLTRYGSIIGSPPDENEEAPIRRVPTAPSLELPAPAVEQAEAAQRHGGAEDTDYDRPVSPGGADQAPKPPSTQLNHRGNAYEVSKPKDILPGLEPTFTNSSRLSQRYHSLFTPQRANSTPDSRPFVRRMFFVGAPVQEDGNDVALEAYRELEFRQTEVCMAPCPREVNVIC
jgi:xenotropic and polytropic retrovirus receptor 1